MRKRSYSIYAADEEEFINQAKLRFSDCDENEVQTCTEASGRKLTLRANDCEQDAYNDLGWQTDERPTKIFDKLRKGNECMLKAKELNEESTRAKSNYFNSYHLNNDHLLSHNVCNYSLSGQTQKTEEELMNEMNQLVRLINSKEENSSMDESDSFICRYFKEILVKESIIDDKLIFSTSQGGPSIESSILLHRINSFNSRADDKDRSLSLNSLKNITLRSIVNTVLSEKMNSNKSQPKLEESFESPTKTKRGQQQFHSSVLASPMTKLSISPINKNLSDPDLVNLESIIIENSVTDTNIKVMLIGHEQSRKMVLETLTKADEDQLGLQSMNR